MVRKRVVYEGTGLPYVMAAATDRCFADLVNEREAVNSLLRCVRSQRYSCYVCQEQFPLSMLVLNDQCRHLLCRLCFSKVSFHNTLETAAGEARSTPLYICLMCRTLESHQRQRYRNGSGPPSVLATLSPGMCTVLEYESDHHNNGVDTVNVIAPPTSVGYRLQLIENTMCGR